MIRQRKERRQLTEEIHKLKDMEDRQTDKRKRIKGQEIMTGERSEKSIGAK